MWEASAETKMPENVYYDTSSSLMYLGKDRGQNYLEKLGPERFLFGTDFPMWTPKEELQRFLALGLDEETNDTILFKNFERLFLR